MKATREQTLRKLVILAMVTLLFETAAGAQQEITEAAQRVMSLFQDAETWPQVAPGDIESRPGQFDAVRSVYTRATDLGTDSPKQARAVWEIEQSAWEGRPVTRISWLSGGAVAPRSSVGYVDQGSGALLYRETSTTRKIVMTLVEAGELIDQSVDRDGNVESEIAALEVPAFDRWALGHMMAGMKLQEGMKFKLRGLYPGVKAPVEYPVFVDARTTIQDVHGNSFAVWPVLHPLGGPNIGTYYVDDRAPYFFGFEARNLLTGEVGMEVRLRHYQRLD